jgi:hypothetical protein
VDTGDWAAVRQHRTVRIGGPLDLHSA